MFPIYIRCDKNESYETVEIGNSSTSTPKKAVMHILLYTTL